MDIRGLRVVIGVVGGSASGFPPPIIGVGTCGPGCAPTIHAVTVAEPDARDPDAVAQVRTIVTPAGSALLQRFGVAAMGWAKWLLLGLTLAVPAAAQEYVSVRGSLGDDDFYRVVACAANPGAGCRKPFLRWPMGRRGNLTVGFVAAGATSDNRDRAFETGLDTALEQINGLEAGVHVRRTDGLPDIAIHIVPTAPGRVMRQTGVAELDGIRLPLARVSIRTRNGDIRKAVIAISSHVRRRDVASLLLEEIVQGLGLITDIRGSAYRRSVFAEKSNSAVRLEGQDAMALRRHYTTAAQYVVSDLSVYGSASADTSVPPSVRLRRSGRLPTR